MKSSRSLMLGVILTVLGTTNSLADLTLYQPGLTPVLRSSGFQLSAGD